MKGKMSVLTAELMDSVLDQMPTETVTLNIFPSGSETVTAGRRYTHKEDLLSIGAMLNENWTNFHLYFTDELVTQAKVGDSLTDSAGKVYQIRKIRKVALETTSICICYLNK